MKYAFCGCLFVMLVSCGEEATMRQLYDTADVERRTIEVHVSSAGVVEPLATVEVKSKASGEVLKLHVENGDYVELGTLLAHIDPRTVRNRLAQAEAELRAAESRRAIAKTQMTRATRLLKLGTFTEADVEQATLDLANAEAQVVTAQVSVENARIAVDDTDVRAPISGTVIQKPVEKGQVISSPTQDVGGGTLLLQMADLSAVQIRALVDETDIGKVRPGMAATVIVAAYPNQPFPGQVVKVEPQAVDEQNVTMFAVLISLRNPQGLLLPGMNAEVEVLIARSENVLTIPVMALRTSRDIRTTADILGITEQEIRRRLAAAGSTNEKRDVTMDNGGERTISIRGRSVELPDGVDADQVRAAMQKRRGGDELNSEERVLLQRVFQSASGQAGGRNKSRSETDYRFGGKFWVVLQSGEDKLVRNVWTGITDLDRVEIVSGLDESSTVLVLPSSHLVETQQELQNQINRRVGSGIPGIGR